MILGSTSPQDITFQCSSRTTSVESLGSHLEIVCSFGGYHTCISFAEQIPYFADLSHEVLETSHGSMSVQYDAVCGAVGGNVFQFDRGTHPLLLEF